MTARAEKEKHQVLAIDTVDEQPVRADVAFAETDIIPCEGVVTVFVRQRLLGSKPVDNGLQFR